MLHLAACWDLFFFIIPFVFIDVVSLVCLLSLRSNFKANSFIFPVATGLETSRLPLVPDYESLRIGGLVFAVVLFLMGIALIVSKSARKLSPHCDCCASRDPDPGPSHHAGGGGEGGTTQAGFCLPWMYPGLLHKLDACPLHLIPALTGCRDPALSLPAHAVTATGPEIQSPTVVHLFRSHTLCLGLCSSESPRICNCKSMLRTVEKKLYPRDPNHADLFHYCSRLSF